ncbi:hypothetical protein Tco_1515498 [Tanacetum coccineum]
MEGYVGWCCAFWETASASTNQDGEMEITATIDGRLKTITEASIRRHLKLEDSAGINSLPNVEIFEQLALMGYGQTLQGEAALSTLQPPSTTPAPHQSPETPHSSPTMPTPQEAEEPATMPHVIARIEPDCHRDLEDERNGNPMSRHHFFKVLPESVVSH